MRMDRNPPCSRTATSAPSSTAASFSPRPTAGTKRCPGNLTDGDGLRDVLWSVVLFSPLSPSQRNGEREIRIDPADFHRNLLARCSPLDKVVLQMSGIVDLGVLHRDNDVVFLDAG